MEQQNGEEKKKTSASSPGGKKKKKASMSEYMKPKRSASTKKKFLFEKIDRELKEIRSAQRARRRRDRSNNFEGSNAHKSVRSVHSSCGHLPLLGSPKKSTSSSGKIKTLAERKLDIKINEEREFMRKRSELRGRLTALREKFNKLKHRSDQKSAEYKTLLNEISMMKREASGMGHNAELQRNILEEKTKLEKTEQRVKEIRSYNDVLKHMANRLWEERHTYEKTLRSYEEVMQVRRVEVDELTDAVAHARHMKEDANASLEKTQRECKEIVAHLESELQGREELFKKQNDMKRLFQDNKKEKNREKTAAALSPSKSNSDGDVMSKVRKQNDDASNDDEEDDASEYEEIFRNIQMTTGLSSEEKIVSYFNRRETSLSEIDERIDRLKREVETAREGRDNAKNRLNEVKFSNDVHEDSNREMIDTLTKRHDEAKKKFRIATEESKKIRDILTCANLTIDSLHKIFAPISLEGDAMSAKTNKSASGEHSKPVARHAKLKGRKCVGIDGRLLLGRMKMIVRKAELGIEQLRAAGLATEAKVAEGEDVRTAPSSKKEATRTSNSTAAVESAGMSVKGASKETETNKIQQIIESSISENTNNIRVSSARPASSKATEPEGKETKDEDEDGDSKDEELADRLRLAAANEEERDDYVPDDLTEEQLKARVLQKKLRARALREGSTFQDEVDKFKRIPHEHNERMLPREELKKASMQLVQERGTEDDAVVVEKSSRALRTEVRGSS